MTAETKTILFILQRAPYGSNAMRESLDAALAAAAFEQNVQLLFSGEGVWGLLPTQNPEAIHSKSIEKMLHALHYYDIKQIYVDEVSLHERKLPMDALAIIATPVAANAMAALVRQADCVINL